MAEVVTGKVQNIRDCVGRVRAVDPGDTETLARDLMRQESILLNVQRACQAAIDLATHLVDRLDLGAPTDSRDAFRRLEHAQRLPADLAANLRAMVGFRNIAVHRYQVLDLQILRSVLDQRLDDLLRFADLAAALDEGLPPRP